MNIGINLLPFRKKLGGAGNYAKNIVRELSEIDKENEYFLFVTKSSIQYFRTKNPHFNFVIRSFNPDFFLLRIFYEQFVLPFSLTKKKIDVLFTPSVAIPFLFRGRMVTTVHDIAFKKLKNKYSFFRRFYLAAVTRLALEKSEIIFTVSEFSRSEILKYCNIRPEKVVVTYNGVNKCFFELVSNFETEVIKKRYNLPDKYILYVGAIEPGKNLERLLRIFSDILKEKPKDDLYLVMTGSMGWKKNIIYSLMKQLRISEKVVILPYVPEEELHLIYKLSQVLVYISYYEGFGLPVLEGIASGVPVVASNIPAIKEVTCNSAVLVSLSDETEIKGKIVTLLSDKEKRNELIKKGLIIAKTFNWEKSAKVIYSHLKVKKVLAK